MAVDGDSWRDVTLGKGMTPTVQLEPGMYVKVDYMMPTLSFKDRGAAALVAHVNNPPSEDGGFIVTASHGPT